MRRQRLQEVEIDLAKAAASILATIALVRDPGVLTTALFIGVAVRFTLHLRRGR